ncbi:MAG: hypothetical protein HKN62_08880 [Phycisphaerales bacterium]|nr:hypothetical protein [Phycisphaerales bacterium]
MRMGRRLSGLAGLFLVIAAPAVASETTSPAAVFTRGADPGVVAVDRATLAATLARTPHLEVELPVPGDATLPLRLERFRVTNPGTRFVLGTLGAADRAYAFDADRVTLLRGDVPGVPGSNVFLALWDRGGQGTIEFGPGRTRYAIRSRPGDPATLTVTRLPAVDATGGSAGNGLEVAWCGAPATPPAAATGGTLNPPTVKQIELAIETDYEYFELFGDLDAACAYIVTLYGAVSDIYIRDSNATFLLTFVRLWDSPDDMFNQESPLGPFADFWRSQMDDVPRAVAQFASGRRDLPWGGVAFLDGLCNDNGYSVIGYMLGSIGDPAVPSVFNRDIILAGHELGHNVAAPHTHGIGIDTCQDAFTDPQRGSIMSYCGQTFTGGDANHDLRFHTLIQQIMRSALVEDDCLGNDCNLNGVDDAEDIDSGASDDDNFDGVPDECQDCNANGQFDSFDISSGVSLDLNFNGYPDECEPDCNDNDVPDDRDIELGDSTDAYGNGIPDECEEDCNDNGTSDYTEIQADMTRDLDRNARLDDCQDCDGDGTPDLETLAGAHNVWIADQSLDFMRQYLWITGTETRVSEDVNLAFPQDVRITPDGRVLVSSRDDDRIASFDLTGGSTGDLVPDGAGGLDKPAGIEFGPAGSILVASSGTHEILQYASDGTPAGVFVSSGSGGLTRPFGLTFGPDGDLYVTSDENQVLRYDGATGDFLEVFVSVADNGGLNQPRGLAFLPSGDLLVASRGTSAVLRYDGETGAFIEKFNRNGTATVMTLDQPWTIRIGPDGDVYVSRAHDHDPLAGPGGDDAATLHLTNARIYHFDATTGNMVKAFVQSLNSNLEHPTGFDFVPGFEVDCNLNLLPDACDIAAGTSLDDNGNGIPDECETGCLGDLDGSGDVGFADLLSVVASWGPCAACPQDLDGSGDVGFADLLMILSRWGAC